MRDIERYTKTNRVSYSSTSKTKQSIFIVIFILLIIAVIALTITNNRSINYQKSFEQQFNKRINGSLIDAIEQVNRLTGGVQANSVSRLAMIRQYIYSIDQINLISISVYGEKGRLVPQEAIQALYGDLDIYERLVQTATSSTLEIRTTLLTHLTALKELL